MDKYMTNIVQVRVNFGQNLSSDIKKFRISQSTVVV